MSSLCKKTAWAAEATSDSDSQEDFFISACIHHRPGEVVHLVIRQIAFSSFSIEVIYLLSVDSGLVQDTPKITREAVFSARIAQASLRAS